MKNPAHKLIPGAISFALLVAPTFANTAGSTDAESQQHGADAATSGAEEELDQVLVVGQRARRTSTGATNLDLEIKETPQSISVVTQEQMQQFGVDSLNDALRMATGIQVEEGETNRTQFIARGFEVRNTQIDGVGLPNGWGIVTNAMDTFGYEKLEVIRGANGLLTGVGNAAGTVNYVRKRPTNDRRGQVGFSGGSWSNRRIEADFSTPFTEGGTWAGRLIAAREDGDSYLRGFQTDRTFVYGVVDGQIGDRGTLAFGYSWQESNSDNNMWGALTYVGTDGRQLEWDSGASTTQDWTYWNTATHTGFAEYTHQLGESWQAKASYNYRLHDNDSQLFFAYAPNGGIDPATGEGLVGWAYKSPYETKEHLVDVSLKGRFELFGREHEAVLGVSSSRSEGTDYWHPTDYSGPAFGELPAFPYGGDAIPEPVWEDRLVYTTLNQRLKRGYAVTRLSLSERLKFIGGFNWAEYHRDGLDDAGKAFDQTESEISPYAGLTFDFTEKVLGYLNYSYIFQPQEQIGIDRAYLDPSKGVNYEAGIKAEWLEQRLLTTVAWFNAKQDGLATYAGYNFDDPNDAFFYYDAVDVESKQGFEFEATGKVNPNTDLVFGLTHQKMTGQGTHTYSWVPRRTAVLMLSTRIPSYKALAFGVGGRWQSDVEKADDYVPDFIVRQGSYAVLNAFAAWDVRPDVTLRAHFNNVTDEKYITSLYQIGYYGAPRNYSLRLDWRF
jgi:outer membrane receptor for ferric coprogen and ferric-rhodotorulic acid